MKRFLQNPSGQSGFAAIAAIIILVILAVLSAGLIKLGTTQQVTSAQDLLAASAWQVARAGNEWGLYQALRLSVCAGAPETLALSGTGGFRVTVTCEKQDFNEGEVTAGTARTITIYTVEAVACNLAASCPDNTMAGTPNYIERKRVVTACDTEGATAGTRTSCY